MNETIHPELAELCRSAVEGELDAAAARQLSELVRTDEAARRFYVDYLEVHALLAWRHGAVEALELPLAGARPQAQSSARPVNRWFISAAAVMLAVGGIFVLLAATGRAPWQTSREEPIAIVLDDANVQWDEETFLDGEKLRSGRQRIDDGVAHIELSTGVLLAAEGPCDFEITAPDRLHLYAGKLHIYSPLATRGFTVTTPRGVQIVDLGTRFGVWLDEAETVHVQLFQGRLRVNNDRELAAGEAIAVDARGVMHEQALQENLFPKLHGE